jgi:lipoprotein-releasing system permease protein
VDWAFSIGFRYLRSKKTKTVSVISFIAVSGVALGVAALLAVMSITSGFQEEFRDKVLGVNAHVLVMRYGDFEEYRDVIARTADMPEVEGAGPFLIKEMMLANGDRIGGVLVKGIDPDLMPHVLDLPDQMVDGTLEGIRVPGSHPPRRPEESSARRDAHAGEDLDAYLEDVSARYEGRDPSAHEAAPEEAPAEVGPAPGVIVPLPVVHVPTPEEAEAALAAMQFEDVTQGEEAGLDTTAPDAVPTDRLPGLVVGITLAENLAIHVGDRVRVISPMAGLDTSLFQHGPTTPVSREFRVIGIFSAGFEEYDTHLVYADLYEVEGFFQSGDSVDGVEIRLHDPEDAAMISRRLERLLGGGPYHTMDWEELNHNLFTALEIQKVMLSLVIATIIFVAAFNVIATLIMIVLEKKREIAILKAMGARDSHVLMLFVVQGLAIGLVGTAIGLVLGGGVCVLLERYRLPLDPHVYLIDHLPIQTDFDVFKWTVLIALGICLFATWIPSWWAARLLPADGVRHE